MEVSNVNVLKEIIDIKISSKKTKTLVTPLATDISTCLQIPGKALTYKIALYIISQCKSALPGIIRGK